ncbi:hypothetical protein PM082_020909 [Marasmius tenuissimus]|nr:hypothetical protein PM082_020909 [Marasmius tenuissimus]
MGLSATVSALPEPVTQLTPTLNALQKRAVNCGINQHDSSKCPAGTECNCVVQNPCVGHMCTPSFFYWCVKAGCAGCDCPES